MRMCLDYIFKKFDFERKERFRVVFKGKGRLVGEYF